MDTCGGNLNSALLYRAFALFKLTLPGDGIDRMASSTGNTVRPTFGAPNIQRHGIEGDLAVWIRNWLAVRRQRVVVDGKCSSGVQLLVVYRKDLFWGHCCSPFL